MTILIQRRRQEFVKIANGKSMMEMFLEELDDNITFVFDTYWAQYAGCDVCSWIEKLSGRIEIIHLKDMKVVIENTEPVHPVITEVGSGNMDFPKIIETAEKCGVKYFCVEQDNCP